MKRRPIENGMIPPKDNEEETNNKMSSNVNHSSNNDGYTAERSQSNFRSNQQSNDVKETSSNSNSKHDENINQQTSSVGDEKQLTQLLTIQLKIILLILTISMHLKLLKKFEENVNEKCSKSVDLKSIARKKTTK